MLNVINKIFKYKRLTLGYPKMPMDSKNFLCFPVIDSSILCDSCMASIDVCPVNAVCLDENGILGINYHKCIVCASCTDVCSCDAISMNDNFELATKNKRDLIHFDTNDQELISVKNKIREKLIKKLGRSLQIREVDSGSCNGCDYEVNALNNPFNDIERFGMHFVASPRHADMLLVTGCVTDNMKKALIKTYEAMPRPKLVVAVGACSCSGGIFEDFPSVGGSVDKFLPVDVFIPGCPPRPQAILYGILKAVDKI